MLELLLAILAVGFVAQNIMRRWKSGVSELPRALAGAEAAGIITKAQREQILAHAGQDRRVHPDAAAWLGLIAGLFVVAGASLLIATNWESIGPGTRIAAFLVLLVAIGDAAIRFSERAVGLSLLLEMLWFFLPLLGIGLYAQTFQLSGDPIRPWLVWIALTAALAWTSVRPVVAMVHTAVMVIVLFVGNFVLTDPVSVVMGSRSASAGLLAITGDLQSPAAWILTALVLGAIALQSMRLLPQSHRHHFVGVWAFWLFGVLVTSTPLQIHHTGWIVLAAVAIATSWVVVLAAFDTSLEERATSMVVWLGVLYAMTFAWHLDRPASGEVSAPGLAIVALVALGAIGGAIALPARRLSPIANWARAGKVLLVAPLVLALFFLANDVRFLWAVGIAMNGLLMLVAVALMWHGSLVHDLRHINAGVLVLIVVLVTRFLDVFGSMIQSGVGFIVAGLLLAGLSWALERMRRRLIGAQKEAVA